MKEIIGTCVIIIIGLLCLATACSLPTNRPTFVVHSYSPNGYYTRIRCDSFEMKSPTEVTIYINGTKLNLVSNYEITIGND